MKKQILFLTILTFLFASVSFARDDISFFTRTDLNIDESLNRSTEFKYQKPQEVYIAHIRVPQEHLYNDTSSWLRFFHYYSTTRLNLPDIPFNYIIDSSGLIYETLQEAESRKPYLDSNDGVVLIGYFSNDIRFTPSAQESLKKLIEKYSFRFGINMDNIKTVKLLLPQEDSNMLRYEDSETLFRLSVFSIIKDFEYSQESNLQFSGKIKELEHEEKVDSGEKFEVKLTLENRDSFPWYVDEDMVFLSVVGEEESPFAVNQVWDSFTKVLALEHQVILPNETVEVIFEMDTEGVLPGKYEEEFYFSVLSGNDILGTEFKVTFEIERGNRQIVEIRPTGTGGLTVYGCPNHTCEMVAGAISGEKYLVLEQEDRWYKIYVDGVEGWVIMNYATLVD